MFEWARDRQGLAGDFLTETAGRGSKTERQVAMHTAMARFPYVKTLETFSI